MSFMCGKKKFDQEQARNPSENSRLTAFVDLIEFKHLIVIAITIKLSWQLFEHNIR